MANEDKLPGLQLAQDLGFQARQSRAARVTWVILLLVMICTLAGLFGKGALSSVHAPGPEARFSVEYGRFGRFGSSMRLTVHAPPGTDGAVRFSLNRALVESFRIRAITPNPAAARLVGDAVEYRFEAEQTQGAPVVFDLQPAQRWLVRGAVRAPEGAVEFWQFIYP